MKLGKLFDLHRHAVELEGLLDATFFNECSLEDFQEQLDKCDKEKLKEVLHDIHETIIDLRGEEL